MYQVKYIFILYVPLHKHVGIPIYIFDLKINPYRNYKS